MRRFTLAATLSLVGPLSSAAQDVPVGIASSSFGSFAATILKAAGRSFDSITAKTPTDRLAKYRIIVVDNLYSLRDLNGAAFKSFVEQGGVLLILNPKKDGYSKTWAPYDLFIGDFTREAEIRDKKHPLFKGFTSDRIADLADSNGPFVGNCSFMEPAKEWKVLAKQRKGKGAVIVEAGYGKGWVVAACIRLDHYNAKPGATRLGDNLLAYLTAKAGG